MNEDAREKKRRRKSKEVQTASTLASSTLSTRCSDSGSETVPPLMVLFILSLLFTKGGRRAQAPFHVTKSAE
jgi:hypothetical protein